MTDYPDWQTPVTWRSAPFAGGNPWPLSAANPLTGELSVENFQAIAVNIGSAGLAGATLTLTFYDGPAHAFQMGSVSWDIPAGVILQCITPCLGGWLKYTLSGGSVLAQDVTATLAATNTPVFSTRYWGPQNYRRTTNLVVPAGQSLLAVMPYIAEGAAYLYFKDRTASGQTGPAIYDLNLDATVNERHSNWAAPQTEIHQQVTVPGKGLGILISNQDVANPHNVDYSFTIDGR